MTTAALRVKVWYKTWLIANACIARASVLALLDFLPCFVVFVKISLDYSFGRRIFTVQMIKKGSGFFGKQKVV